MFKVSAIFAIHIQYDMFGPKKFSTNIARIPAAPHLHLGCPDRSLMPAAVCSEAIAPSGVAAQSVTHRLMWRNFQTPSIQGIQQETKP